MTVSKNKAKIIYKVFNLISIMESAINDELYPKKTSREKKPLLKLRC